MKGRIKCILSGVSYRPLLFALLLLLSLASSSLTSLPVSAASDYDDVIQTIDEVYVQSSTLPCTKQDLTLTWGGIMLNSANWQDSWGQYLMGADATASIDAFNDALDNTTGWAVSQHNYQPGSSSSAGVLDDTVNVQFSPSETAYVDFGTVGGRKFAYMRTTDSGYVYNVKISFRKDANDTSPNSTTCRPFVNQTARWTGDKDVNWINSNLGAQNFTIASDVADDDPTRVNTSHPLFINADIKYPEGYEGTEPPDDVGTPTVVKPDFTYAVNGKDVTAKDYNFDLPDITPDEGYTIEGYSVEWTLYKCGTWNPNPDNTCEDSSIAKYQILSQEDTFNFTVAEYGDYTLQANYIVQQCYRYPSYPATPDYCFNVDFGAEAELEDFDFTSTTVYLAIDGGSTSGDTRDGECDESGFCTPPSPYEDCSTYGLDVVGGLGCVIRNFGVWLTNTLKMLFIPTASFFEELFSEFGEFFNTKLGFVAYPISFLIGFFTDVMNAAGSPRCSLEGGSIFGVNADVNLCTMQNSVPQIYNAIIIFIRATVVFALVYALYHKYHDIVSEGGSK